MISNIQKQQGIGLIEVLVAVLIFALGTLALAKLNDVIFRQATIAQARYAAITLAEKKLEDLRNFKSLDDPDNDVFSFVDIGTNSGGRCDAVDDDACALLMPNTNGAKTITLGNITYSLDWSVTNYYYQESGSPLSLNLVTTATGPIQQKQIIITVTWTDIDGKNQSLSLTGVINRNSGESGGVLINNTGGSGESPTVTYTPSTDSKVTPISVGTDSQRETLVPGSTTVDGYTFTEFTAYTYASNGVLLRQEDFKNVACECAFNGVSTDDEPTYGPSYPAWDTLKGTYVDVTGELISGKTKGCVDANNNGSCDSNPNEYCNICCRDHHDSNALTRKYDPYRSSDDFVSGNHKHYQGTSPVTTGTYLESCRLKRIDGYWRVYQDWHQVNYKILALSDLTDSTLKQTYADFVNDVIDAYIDESKVQGETLTSTPTLPSTLNHTVSANYIAMSVGDKADLSGRGIYLDYMDSTHLAQVQAKKAANQDYLLHVPYYEVDVTSVSQWSSVSPSVVRVGPYDGPGTANDLSGGQMEALSTDSSSVQVIGHMKKSASGLTALSNAIDYNAATNGDDEENTHVVNICVGCSGAASCLLPWGGTVAHAASVTAYATASDPATCVSETRTCNNGTLSGTYQYQSCSVITPGTDCTAPWGAIITNGGNVTAYQTQNPPATCIFETRTCTNGTLSGSYLHQNCTVTPVTCNTTVTGKANNKDDTIVLNDGTSNYSCPVATNKNYSCPTVTTSTSTTITVTSTGSVNTTSTLSTICGAQTVNF